MTRFNLLPWRAQRRRLILRQCLSGLIAVGLVATAMLAVCAQGQRQRVHQQEKANASWTARLQTLDRSRQQAADARATLDDVRRQQAELSALRASGEGMPVLLRWLEAALPTDLRLTTLTFEQQRLLVSGEASSGLGVAGLMQAFQSLPSVGSVTLQDLQARGDAQVFRIALELPGGRS